MWKNYLKTTLRNLSRNKIYSFLNIIGLGLGMALFITIMLFVSNEYKYDMYNKNVDNIYRLEYGDKRNCHMTSAMAIDLHNNFPEITNYARVKTWGDMHFRYKESIHKINSMFLMDSNALDIFTFKFIHGSPQNALTNPTSVLLTQETSQRIFGDENSVGEILELSGYKFEVKGVLEDMPYSHMSFDIIAPFHLLGQIEGDEMLYNYRTTQFPTYFIIQEGTDIKNLEVRIKDFFYNKFVDLYGEDIFTEDDLAEFYYYLNPLSKVYLTNNSVDYKIKHGNPNTIKIFIIVGIFIIVIACINFINITTARGSTRAVEVGVRKVHGGLKSSIVKQFLSESIALSFIALFTGLTIVQLLLPLVNGLLQKDLYFVNLLNPLAITILLTGTILIGLVSGIYPAFYLSAFKPLKVLKGEITKGKNSLLFRRTLIVVQFSISIALIIATVSVQKQLNYIKNKDIGINKENVLAFSTTRKIRKDLAGFKHKIKQHPNIFNVSYSMAIQGHGGNYESFDFNSEGEQQTIALQPIDPDFVDLYEVEITQGRNFSYENHTDTCTTILLNETAIKKFNIENPVDKIFKRDGWYITAIPSKTCKIIGVFKDFNFQSLHNPIEPMGMSWTPNWYNWVSVKVGSNDIDATIAHIESIYKEYNPEMPFEYTFIDDEFNNMYKSEERLRSIFGYFSVIAIIIAILGLVGLSAYIAQSRTKEIGIRKALGSSILKINVLLSREFARWVLLANIIAIPITWYSMNIWLENFAFRTKITVDVFIISTVVSFLVAQISISYQTIKAAKANPAKSLKYE